MGSFRKIVPIKIEKYCAEILLASAFENIVHCLSYRPGCLRDRCPTLSWSPSWFSPSPECTCFTNTINTKEREERMPKEDLQRGNCNTLTTKLWVLCWICVCLRKGQLEVTAKLFYKTCTILFVLAPPFQTDTYKITITYVFFS